MANAALAAMGGAQQGFQTGTQQGLQLVDWLRTHTAEINKQRTDFLKLLMSNDQYDVVTSVVPERGMG
jgi:hypothetical protein